MIKHGIPVYDGIVMGKARLYRQWRFDPDSLHESEDAAERTQAYQAAVERAQGELELIRASLSAAPEKAKIIDAHMLLLQDFAMDDMIRADIAAGKTAAAAIGDTYDMFIGVLGDTDNDFTQQKVSDLYDVRGRLLRCLAGEEDRDLSRLPGPCVIFAKDLYPTDTATIDRKNVLAIVTETGNMTSHTAILARSFGITTVLGVEGVTELVEDGDTVAVDGTAGTVCIRPDEKEQAEYLARTAQAEEAQNRRLYYMGRPSVTADGVRVLTELNISAVDDTDEQALASCDGVGLMRSEFLYMRSKDALPDEEWQFREYKAALDALGGKSLILRTLDIGGDKQLECLPLPKEDNPFLGVRALRLCFERPEIFRTQLRAALRASAYGDLWLMFPMVGGVDDFRRAKAFVLGVMDELDAEHIPFNRDIKLGVMIEIPSAALMADALAAEADFGSIGTNDLCQYTLAADRMNERTAPYYRSCDPAVLRLIRYAAQEFSKAGKPLGVCGEMAGEAVAAAALVGLGIRTLSMGPGNMPAVKEMLASLSCADAKERADAACAAASAAEARFVLEKGIVSR